MEVPCKKLNFGCGHKIAPNWTNIDFQSVSKQVRHVNLLKGFPFRDNEFDYVYSSHVLEHFTPEQGAFIIGEAFRVLKPGGLVRTVVPDLEGSCREYLRILSLPDGPSKKQLHEWISIELLDQMVRTEHEGAMGRYLRTAMASSDAQLVSYILSRTHSIPLPNVPRRSLARRLRGMTLGGLSSKLTNWYIKAVKTLLPPGIRSMVTINTSIGERHRWMYDSYSLKKLHVKAGFSNVRFCEARQSGIPALASDCLDLNSDGSPYKNNSIYCEAQKPYS